MNPASRANLKPYQPGQSGNISGRPKLPPELRLIQQFTRGEIAAVIAKYGRATADEITEVINDPNSPNLDVAICKIWKGTRGDYGMQALGFLMDRSIGKPVDIEQTGDPDTQITVTKENIKELYDIARTA